MRFTKAQVIELAKEVAGRANDKVHTLVFSDGSITQINGAYSTSKTVWVDFEGCFTAQEALDALWEGCFDENGEPYTPK